MNTAIAYHIGPQGLLQVNAQTHHAGFWERLKIVNDLLQEEQMIVILTEKPLSAIQVFKISHAFNYAGHLGGPIKPEGWDE